MNELKLLNELKREKRLERYEQKMLKESQNYSYGMASTFTKGNFHLKKALEHYEIVEEKFKLSRWEDSLGYGGQKPGELAIFALHPNINYIVPGLFHEIGHAFFQHWVYFFLTGKELKQIELEANLFSYYCMKELHIKKDRGFLVYLIERDVGFENLELADYKLIQEEAKNFIEKGRI